MPVRRSRVDTLELLAYEDGVASLDLRVGSGTYVRAIADALGGHCRTLRRTEVGPFSVDDADDGADPARRRGAAVPARGRGGRRARRRRSAPAASAREPDARTTHDGRLVAVGSVVMPV